jgi:hypothetical protein
MKLRDWNLGRWSAKPPAGATLNDYDESRPPIDLLRPYESDGMTMTPANRLVGNVRNNGPDMLIARE